MKKTIMTEEHLSFRKGGRYKEYGIWYSMDGLETLVNPCLLAYSLGHTTGGVDFFIPDQFNEMPALDKSEIDPFLLSLEGYRWSFEDEFALDIVWDEFSYQKVVMQALMDLYNYAVVDCRGQAYGHNLGPISESIQIVIESLGLTCNAFPFPVKAEPFIATFNQDNTSFHLSIDSVRNISFNYGKTDPQALLHDLEHIVFHKKTTLSFPGQENAIVRRTGIVMLERIDIDEYTKRAKGQSDGRLIRIYCENIDSPLNPLTTRITGICDEKIAVSRLYSTLLACFPSLGRSKALDSFIHNNYKLVKK